jgi:hypothetical protein
MKFGNRPKKLSPKQQERSNKMSTNGCIAFGTPNEWIGVYHHWDSYPTELGKTLWAAYQENPVTVSREMLLSR